MNPSTEPINPTQVGPKGPDPTAPKYNTNWSKSRNGENHELFKKDLAEYLSSPALAEFNATKKNEDDMYDSMVQKEKNKTHIRANFDKCVRSSGGWGAPFIGLKIEDGNYVRVNPDYKTTPLGNYVSYNNYSNPRYTIHTFTSGEMYEFNKGVKANSDEEMYDIDMYLYEPKKAPVTAGSRKRRRNKTKGKYNSKGGSKKRQQKRRSYKKR